MFALFLTHFARAFFDDGTPCGVAASPECSIDAISQAWAVIAGGTLLCAVLVGVVESSMARYRFLKVPPLLLAGLVTGFATGGVSSGVLKILYRKK